MLNRLTDLYPVWLLLTALLAFYRPDFLAWFHGQWIAASLMTVMLSMGLTLTIDDFRRLLRAPGCVCFGFLMQYSVMPLLAWGLATVMHFESSLAVGLILVGSCPGGTASNVIAYLAGADVALSVVLTMASTLLAFIMTPLLCQFFAGQYVPVDALGLCLSTLQVVVLPVLVGAFCNWKFPKTVNRISWLGPIVSVIAICLITGGIVAQSADVISENILKLMAAVTLLHGMGFLLGYAVTRVAGYSGTMARTVSIEVGMQNGGMAAMLAKSHFASHPLAAVPAVISAILQNVLGSLLAAVWRARSQGEFAAERKKLESAEQ